MSDSLHEAEKNFRANTGEYKIIEVEEPPLTKWEKFRLIIIPVILLFFLIGMLIYFDSGARERYKQRLEAQRAWYQEHNCRPHGYVAQGSTGVGGRIVAIRTHRCDDGTDYIFDENFPTK